MKRDRAPIAIRRILILNPPVVRFDEVQKRYGDAHALRGVSFTVESGRFVGLAGLNGAGKTSLIKSMLDLCAIDAGRIELFGTDHRSVGARERIAFMPERFMPPHHLHGRDFVRMMLKLRGPRADQTDEDDETRLRETLAALDFDVQALDRPARTYSKGMTQKLGLAVCLMLDREFYVLDEPMSGLDPRARVALRAQLDALKKRGKTVLFTSHELADMQTLCDELLVLHQGVPFYAGPPNALCEYYEDVSLESAFLRCIEAPAHERNYKSLAAHR